MERVHTNDVQPGRLGRWPLLVGTFFTCLPFGVGAQGAAEGSLLRQVVWSVIFLAAGLALIRGWRTSSQTIATVDPWIYALLLYIAASVVWSPEPYISFKRAVQVWGVFLVALAVGTEGFSPGQTPRLLRSVVTLLMLLSLILVVVTPGWAITEKGWRGIMQTKNQFGQIAFLSFVLWLYALRVGGPPRYVSWLLIVGSVIVLALTRSYTSIAAFLVVVGLGIAGHARWLVTRSWGATVLAAVLATLTILHFAGVVAGYPSLNDVANSFFDLIGRDVTLAGRTYLWELMWQQFLQHPWLGLGYGGFWIGFEGPSGLIAYKVGWGYPGQAHNGYLDILNELGIVGSALVIGVLSRHALRIFKLFAIDRDAALFHLVILGGALALNVAEASFLRITHPWWIVVMLSIMEVGYLVARIAIAAQGNGIGRSAPGTPVAGPMKRASP
ncbi:MAG: O-antigen ligase family protein [Burkholderiales bacterium]|nr:O-antigen ligase family protein [Burkholderiales bacterium]